MFTGLYLLMYSTLKDELIDATEKLAGTAIIYYLLVQGLGVKVALAV